MVRFVMIASLLLVGCGKTITDDDCRKVATNMHDVWLAQAKAEAAKVAPADSAGIDKANAVIKSDADKLAADVSAECKKELQGRRVDSKEMDCVLAAKTFADVNKCAGL
jgi:hypothetical protein